MTELNKDVKRLRELLERAGAEKWVLQDGCSWRRIGTDHGPDGDILCPYNSRHDNHPDLSAPDGVLELIVETHNALPAILDERDSLLSQVGVMREALEAIRCNTEPNTLGTICDLPEGTTHTREQHLEAQIRAINWFVRDALSTLPTVGGETAAARDVLAERKRQISQEGWTPEHDDEHSAGQMATAAAAYAFHSAAFRNAEKLGVDYSIKAPHPLWPWDRSWWKPKSPRRDLVRAGALILAEIERLDRAQAPTPTKSEGEGS